MREERGEGKEKGSGGVISIDEITLTNTTVSGNLRQLQRETGNTITHRQGHHYSAVATAYSVTLP